MKINTLFISKNPKEIGLIADFCKIQHIDIQGISFIEFNQIKNNVSTNSKVYFFGSKNAFDFYLNLAQPKPEIKLACVGISTKKHIESKGYQVSFYGEEAGNPEEVSKQLLDFIGSERITFFQSNISKRSISKHIPENQREECVVYETILKEIELNQTFEVYVFTSPSNVDAFLRSNSISKTAQVIAWGKVTAEALLKEGITPSFTLKKASQEELIELLQSNFF